MKRVKRVKLERGELGMGATLIAA